MATTVYPPDEPAKGEDFHGEVRPVKIDWDRRLEVAFKQMETIALMMKQLVFHVSHMDDNESLNIGDFADSGEG